MAKTNKTAIDAYNAPFAVNLRAFMDKHPQTGEKTTQKQLAEYLGVRPQTVSCYCTGESIPNVEQLIQIKDYFGATAEYMITGKLLENMPVREMLGLSENTVQNMKLVKDGYFEDTPSILAMLDCLLGDKDFYLTLERAAKALESKEEVDSDELKEFYEWKAASNLQEYFLEFFRRDLLSMYIQNQ